MTSDVFANKNYDSIILSLTLWYLVPLTFGQVGAVPLPLGKRPAQQGCAAGPVPLHLTRPRGCPLPLPLPQLSGSASLSLPNSHPSPSDLTRLHKGHPGTRTLPAAGGARPPPRSRSPSLAPTSSPRPVPGSRQPRCFCRWRWRQRRGLAAIQWLLPRGWKLGSGCPSTGNSRVCRCAWLFTHACQCLHTGARLSLPVRALAVP